MSDSNDYYQRLANAELERRQAAIDAACAAERARIATWLRDRAIRFHGDAHYALIRVAEKLEHGVLMSDSVVAGDE